jgi:uncharacterized protein
MTAITQNSSVAASDAPAVESTEQLIRRLAELLPMQGPITAFAFLNPLQGMEDQHFVEALRQVADIFGCEPFLPEGSYREKMARGRITGEDLIEILAEEPGFDGEHKIAGLVRHSNLRLHMLQHSINPSTEQDLQWIIAETDALVRFRTEISHNVRERLIDSTRKWVSDGFPGSTMGSMVDFADELRNVVQNAIPRTLLGGSGDLDENAWEAVSLALLWWLLRTRIQRTSNGSHVTAPPVRHRDLLMAASSEDSDGLVHEILIQFSAVFLDQGYAQWKLPQRGSGFFRAFRARSTISYRIWYCME